MNILGHEFQGPFSIDQAFNAVAGIYLILSPVGNRVVDVGETGNLEQRIPYHERKPDWRRHGGTHLWFHHEAHEPTRLAKESLLRQTYNPPCGER